MSEGSLYVQANTNGILHPADTPSITPVNRGFLYGDAIYEVWRTYDRVLFAWNEHWERMEASAKALHMPLPWGRDYIWAQITKTVEAYEKASDYRGEYYVRLQVSRGGGEIGLDISLADGPDFVILVKPVPVLSQKHWAHGQVLSVARQLHRNPPDSLNPAWKTGNYLNNLLCLREAKSRGADEVVILNRESQVTEAAVCNLAFIKGKTIITPALSCGILAGVTRRLLISPVAQMAGLEISESIISEAELGGFDECFLLSTTKDIQPVGRIDDYQYVVGEGTQARVLKQAFAEYAASYAQAHPELKI